MWSTLVDLVLLGEGESHFPPPPLNTSLIIYIHCLPWHSISGCGPTVYVVHEKRKAKKNPVEMLWLQVVNCKYVCTVRINWDKFILCFVVILFIFLSKKRTEAFARTPRITYHLETVWVLVDDFTFYRNF